MTLRPLILCSLLCAAVVPAAAEPPQAPFAPLASVPDYVITMVEYDGDAEITHTIAHHGKWIRIDTIAGPLYTTRYFSPLGPTEIEVIRRGSNDAIGGRFVLGAKQNAFWHYDARDILGRQALLGETCRRLSVLLERDRPSTNPSCVAERRSVAANEVEPPRDLFTVSWWMDGATIPSASWTTTDYETVMRQRGGLRRDLIRTTRRHDPWTYVEETAGDQWRELRVISATHRFNFTAADTRFRQPQRLIIWKLPPDQLSPSISKALDAHDTMLGERCDWFDTMPMVSDGGQRQCRTADGVVLKERNFGWGSDAWYLDATQLSRRPLSLDEVMPPASLLDPKFWGLD
jgi:hypothetical protein